MPITNKIENLDGFSRSTRFGLSLIATEIQLTRKKRKMTQLELATRVGCSRDTIRAMEAGKPTVAIAFVFEAAAMLGYKSGSEMLDDLINAPAIKDVADTRAEAVMVERHGGDSRWPAGPGT